MNGQYKKDLDKYSVPPKLKQDTIEKMKQAYQSREEEPAPTVEEVKPQKSVLSLWLKPIAAIAAVVVVAVGVVNVYQTQSPIITPLTSGSVEQSVALKDGELQFNTESIVAGNTRPSLGTVVSTQTVSVEDYQEQLQVSLPKEELKGYTLDNQTAELVFFQSGALFSDRVIRTYQNKAENNFRVVLTTTTNGNYELEQGENNSVIEDTPLRINWKESTNQFTAQYQKDDLYFFVESSNTDQEQFILFLIALLKGN